MNRPEESAATTPASLANVRFKLMATASTGTTVKIVPTVLSAGIQAGRGVPV